MNCAVLFESIVSLHAERPICKTEYPKGSQSHFTVQYQANIQDGGYILGRWYIFYHNL